MKEGQKSVGANGKQNSMFPMDVMYITQGESGDFSHSKAKAIDYIHLTKAGVRTRSAWYYAPADMTVINQGSAGTMWVTDDEVNTPTGTKRMCYMFWHDNNHSNYKVGDKRKQGEKCGQTGTAGFATGDHLHIEVMNGAVFDKSNAIHNWDAFFINDTEIVVDFGYAWKTTDDQTGIDNGTCEPPSNSGNGSFDVNERVNDKVKALRPIFEKECDAQGVGRDAVAGLMAIAMVESEGNLEDVMQSSESAGLPMNTLGREASIKQGVKHFKESLETTKLYGCDMWTAFQQYNYGIGYAKWIGQRGKVHTLELSIEYSRTVVAPSLGNTTGQKVPYNRPEAIEIGYPWRYKNGGNFHYARVLQLYTTGNGAINSCGGDNTGEKDKEKNKLDEYIAHLMVGHVKGWVK